MCGCDINQDGVYCDPFTLIGGAIYENLLCPSNPECISPDDIDGSCADYCELQDANDTVTGFDYQVGVVACANYEDVGGCTSWAPSSNISYSGGTYYVDDTWLANTAATPAPLWTCDDAYVDVVAAGGFDVHNASSGEALYELGLRNGDVILSVNGLSLDSYTDAMIAWTYLYWSGTTSYALGIERSSSSMTLYYVIST